MYEKPEDISLALIDIATPLAVAAIAHCQTQYPSATLDIVKVITACGSLVHHQFGFVRDAVDNYSTEENTELLEVKLRLLKLAAESTVQLLPSGQKDTISNDTLIAAVTTLYEHCVQSVCKQYEQFQSSYFERNPKRRPQRRNGGYTF